MRTINKIKYITFLTIAFLAFSNSLFSQVPEEILLSLKTGNSKVLSGYFNQNVELAVLDNDNVYSKAQAEQIVSKFFDNHKPRENGFKVIHKGGTQGAQYLIGSLQTNNGIFRVYFLLKQKDGKDYIHQLKIEKQ